MWIVPFIIAGLFALNFSATNAQSSSSRIVEAPSKVATAMVETFHQDGGARLLHNSQGREENPTRSPFQEDDPSGHAARVNRWYEEHPEYAPKQMLPIGDPIKPQPTQPPQLEAPRSTPVVAQNEYQLVAKVTGYSSSVNETDDSPTITASNTTTRHGVVANNCLPLGTEIELKGLRGVESGIYYVEDTKAPRFGCEWIDVWRSSKGSARKVGVQHTTVRIVRYGTIPNPRVKG